MQKSPQRMREQRGDREVSEISGKDSMNNGWNAPWVSKMSRNGAAAASHVSNTASALRWDRNWRKGGLYERRNILARQFYNQQYCGCEFSLRRLTE